MARAGGASVPLTSTLPKDTRCPTFAPLFAEALAPPFADAFAPPSLRRFVLPPAPEAAPGAPLSFDSPPADITDIEDSPVQRLASDCTDFRFASADSSGLLSGPSPSTLATALSIIASKPTLMPSASSVTADDFAGRSVVSTVDAFVGGDAVGTSETCGDDCSRELRFAGPLPIGPGDLERLDAAGDAARATLPAGAAGFKGAAFLRGAAAAPAAAACLAVASASGVDSGTRSPAAAAAWASAVFAAPPAASSSARSLAARGLAAAATPRLAASSLSSLSSSLMHFTWVVTTSGMSVCLFAAASAGD
mmetsp:Transcript_69036/g.199893  ORF Transcript_69036/g.199893 Transcript_69036/m.199893 type:complete len:307 (-) Transcript_69036:317-1237(-)